MDGPCATRFYCQLFAYRSCGCIRRGSGRSHLLHKPKLSRFINVFTNDRRIQASNNVEWKQRTDSLPPNRLAEFSEYAMTTADQLRSKNRRPRRIKMLMRDFIEDSLYNPVYGYFSRQAVIFDPGEPFDFPNLHDEAHFHNVLGQRYTVFEDGLDSAEFSESRQLWHTPTELFRPHYAEAVARYIIANYKISVYPYHDLIIYELGAGNGTFMLNVLDYILEVDPEVYARTKYKVIEISPSLADLQVTKVRTNMNRGDHLDRVEIINQSIFNWNNYVPAPCFVLAMEVIDNFAHDVVRYNPGNEQALQGTVFIDTHGEFYEFYTPYIDPIAARFFRIRDAACQFPVLHPLRWSKTKRQFRAKLPFAPNLSEPEYIPTRLMEFFDVLQKYFPAHKLLLSDFHCLPNSILGINAPVVQTRYKRQMVPVTTPLVRQGYFDILFPTDFKVMEGIYQAITGKFTRILSHEEFMRRWAYMDDTTTKNGDNPLLSWYKNTSVMTTV